MYIDKKRSGTDEQRAIKQVVANYKTLHPEEYKIVCKGIDMKRKMNADEYARVDGSEDMRGLYEVSETLMNMLVRDLTLDQTNYLKTIAGGRWFAKTFREFSLPTHI